MTTTQKPIPVFTQAAYATELDPNVQNAKDQKARSAHREKSTPLAPPNEQVRTTIEQWTLGDIFNKRLDLEIPDFQRGKVWDGTKERGFMDSAARHWPTQPLLIFRQSAAQGSDFNIHDFVLDGLQRKTSIEDFLLGKFRTFRKDQLDKFQPNDNDLEAIIPNLFWNDLPKVWQKWIMDYRIGAIIVENVEERHLAQIFFRLQIHSALTVGELLWAYNSGAKKAVNELYEHDFWGLVYKGNKNVRQERAPEVLTMMGIELTSTDLPFVQIRKPELLRMASGKIDKQITPFMLDRMRARLARYMNVFAGAEATARMDALAIYQCGILLERHGFDLAASQRSCLVPVFRRWKHTSIDANGSTHGRLESEFNAIAKLGNWVKQKQFWEEQLPLVEQTHGLVRRAEY